ncbi:MAG: hypothetical protein NTX82_04920 [Candidatus Parcubacteria bacterium]|nr:hypothetical protein [Candidatus Parcubacteria bacterium]
MKQIRLACIASGSGTDFKSIANAWKDDWLPEVSEVVLISTKEYAGCIDKANALDIRYSIVDPGRSKHLPLVSLQNALEEFGGVALIFLVGCIVKVPELGIPMYNIHPADPHKHGGQGMYGLKVHLHVLAAINDLIKRGMAKATDRFFTEPTVHEVVAEYDKGHELLRAQVEIPQDIIQAWVTGIYEGNEEDAAKKLQQIVLPFEHQMLPLAVRLAAKKILDQQNEQPSCE